MELIDIPGWRLRDRSALISSDSEYFQVCFSAVHYLKISEQRWFSSEQRWKRKFSELKISAETALFSSETEMIQSWTALIFSETALKLEIFRAKKSALNQSCFSADFLWNRAVFSETALKHQIFRAKKSALNQSCFSADFLWNRAEQRWFSLTQRWKTIRPEQEKSALNQCCFSADFPWKRSDTHWSLLKQLSSFLIFPWDNAEHPETSYSFSANFCRKAVELSWKFRNYSIMAKRDLILFPQIFSR